MRLVCQERRGILTGVLLAVLAGCHPVIAPPGANPGLNSGANPGANPDLNSGQTAQPAPAETGSGQDADRHAEPDAANSEPALSGPSLSGPSFSGPSFSGPTLSGPPPAAAPTVILVPAQSICQNLQRQFQQIFLSTRQLHQRLFALAEKQRRRLAADQRGYWPTLSLLANPRQPLHGQFARLLSGYVTARQHFIQQRCPFILPPSPVQQIKQMDSRHFQPASWP